MKMNKDQTSGMNRWRLTYNDEIEKEINADFADEAVNKSKDMNWNMDYRFITKVECIGLNKKSRIKG